MKDTMHIKGLAELDRKLAALPINIRKNVLRSSLRAAGAVIGKAARALAPDVWVSEHPSRLKKKPNILWRVSRIRGNTARVKITWATAPRGVPREQTPYPFYGHWVEFGIPSKGVPAFPFLRPAFQQKQAAALEAFSKKMSEGIDKEVDKLNHHG